MSDKDAPDSDESSFLVNTTIQSFVKAIFSISLAKQPIEQVIIDKTIQMT